MIFILILFIIVTYMVVEYFMLKMCIFNIPIRIHVHGTRGKSSTVKICASILRQRGLKVVAKMTGDYPEWILPSGKIKQVRRIGPPRIHELVAIIRMAKRLGADAIVLEGMALSPETVWQSEKIICATHAIITNTRPDHAETMGCGRSGVTQTLGMMVPYRRELHTLVEQGVLDLAIQAKAKACSLRLVHSCAPEQQPGALAVSVANSILPEAKILQESPCFFEGCPTWLEISGFIVPVKFIDLFSANDVESSRMLSRKASHNPLWLRVGLLATRADRPLRTCEFVAWLKGDSEYDLLVPQGSHAGYVWLKNWRSSRVMITYPWMPPVQLIKGISERARAQGRSGVELVGLANYHGVGEKWRSLMKLDYYNAD